jgi:hypothetical protein
MGSLGGFYCMADEQAYFRVSGEKASVSIAEFEKRLRKELHPNFFVVYNPTITRPDQVQGHQIGFFVPEYNGFVPLCKVGKSGTREIPANSQGKMVKKAKDLRGEDEVAVVFRGYVAAYEACKAFINDIQIDGIKPSRCISAKDFFIYKKMAQEIGGSQKLHEAFEEGRKLAMEHELKLAAEAALKEAEATKAVEAYIETKPVEEAIFQTETPTDTKSIEVEDTKDGSL